MNNEHSENFQPNENTMKDNWLPFVLSIERNQTLLDLGYHRVTDSSIELVNLVVNYQVTESVHPGCSCLAYA